MAVESFPIVFMTKCGPCIHKKYGPKIISYLESLEHTYVPRVGAAQKTNLLSYASDSAGEWLILPRSALYRLAGFAVHDMRGLRDIRARSGTNVDFLYDDQEHIVSYICRELRQTLVAALCLDLRAGYGKTFIAAGVIATLGARTLYIVPTRELARQVSRDIRATIDNEIMIAQSSKHLIEIAQGSRLNIVVVINTAMKARIDYGALFDLIVFDEAHMYCCQNRSQIFRVTQSRWILGLSATIGERRDGLDFAIPHYFGRVVDAQDIPGFAYDNSQIFDVRVRAIHYLNPNARNIRHASTDMVFAHYMYEQFGRDMTRNNLIVSEAQKLLQDGHNVFIFSQERAHVELIAAQCIDAGIISREQCSVFYGGISAQDRADTLDRARLICATYSYSGTGISIVRMSAAILAMPRYANMKQIIGRILRRGSDVNIPRIIVDIIDDNTCLSRQWRWRKNTYAYYGAKYEPKVSISTVSEDSREVDEFLESEASTHFD